MPELPEVETTKNELKLILLNNDIEEIIINTVSLRIPIKKKKIKALEGLKVKKITRRGKYILITLNDNYILLVHLGMSGRLSFKKNPLYLDKHDHFAIGLNNNIFIVFNDPRRFGLIDVITKKELVNYKYLKHLGVEPLKKNFSYKLLKKIIFNRKSNIKNILLNQRLIAGIGNIYACESLYESKISPFKIANTLNKKQITYLCLNIKKVLKKAISLRGSSINDYKSPSGQLGNFQNNFKVYDREGKICKNKKCKKKIIRSVINGRSTYYCESCQKI